MKTINIEDFVGKTFVKIIPTKNSQDSSSISADETQKIKDKIVHKIIAVKKAIIDVLTENPGGLSLAQLPQHVKRKLLFPLDLNELGFVKLKELLGTMPDIIKIEL